jgi:hypothetical protein
MDPCVEFARAVDRRCRDDVAAVAAGIQADAEFLGGIADVLCVLEKDVPTAGPGARLDGGGERPKFVLEDV